MSLESAEKVPLMIPMELYKEIERRVATSDGLFKTPEEYVSFVMSEVVKEETGNVADNGLTPADDEEIKGKLKNLGYI